MAKTVDPGALETGNTSVEIIAAPTTGWPLLGSAFEDYQFEVRYGGIPRAGGRPEHQAIWPSLLPEAGKSSGQSVLLDAHFGEPTGFIGRAIRSPVSSTQNVVRFRTEIVQMDETDLVLLR